MTEAQAKSYPEVYQLLHSRIYQERLEKSKKKSYRNIMDKWWQFWRVREELYNAISDLSMVIVTLNMTKYVIFTFVESQQVFSNTLDVILSDNFSHFAALQSSFHFVWVDKYGTTMRNAGYRYVPTTCYETFPFPQEEIIDKYGEVYYEHRQQLMYDRQEGLTQTYNRFHNPQETAQDIARLRQLHVAMDNAVAAAYGWQDLDLGHGFHETPQGIRYTVSEPARRELLTRLLQLNHERYEEEVKLGLHEKKKKGSRKGAKPRRKKKAKKNEGQLSLL